MRIVKKFSKRSVFLEIINDYSTLRSFGSFIKATLFVTISSVRYCCCAYQYFLSIIFTLGCEIDKKNKKSNKFILPKLREKYNRLNLDTCCLNSYSNLYGKEYILSTNCIGLLCKHRVYHSYSSLTYVIGMNNYL